MGLVHCATIGIGIMQDPLFPCTSLAQQKQKPAEKVGSVRKSWEGGKREQEGKRERANVQLFNAGSTGGGQPSNLGQRKKTSSLVFSPEQTNDSGRAALQTYYVLINQDPRHSWGASSIFRCKHKTTRTCNYESLRGNCLLNG